MSSDDEQVNASSHKRLLSEISDIIKHQHIKKPKRTEPALEVNEFNLVKARRTSEGDEAAQNEEKVSIKSLAKIVKNKTKQKKIVNLVQDTFKKGRTLSKPLEKVHAEKVQRVVAYDQTKNKLSRWDAIVTKNKSSEQLTFPLNTDTARFNSNKSVEPFSQLRYKSQIVKEIESINNECFPKDTTLEEEINEELLTLEEIRERRKELAKLKARESHKIAKKRLQSKIKSKKFHRLRKREELKKKINEFEQLKLSDPEAALREMEKIEKQRVQERANLRHKNTGTWAKNMKVRSKYDLSAKKELEAQLALGRDLTQKTTVEESSDSDDEEQVLVQQNDDNPWLSQSKASSKDPLDEIFSGYKKFWDEKNANDKAMKKLNKERDSSSAESSESEPENNKSSGWIEEDISSDSDNENAMNYINDIFDQAEENVTKQAESKLKSLKPKLLESLDDDTRAGKKKKKTANVNDPKYLEFAKEASLKDIDEALREGSDSENDVDYSQERRPWKKFASEIQARKEEQENLLRGSAQDIDPTDFLSITSKHVISALPKSQEHGDIDEEDIQKIEKSNRISLMEAFQDDDIVNDFIDDVESEAKQNETALETGLPGWGSWSGAGIKKKAKAQKKDNGVRKKDRIIVNTKINDKLKKHLISTVPYPFKSIADFEASMRYPIGKDFVPESAHRKFTIPSVVTKAGTIIEPMTEEVLVKNEVSTKKKFKKFKTKNLKKKKIN